MSNQSGNSRRPTRGIESFFRPASGEGLEALFDRLEPFESQCQDLKLPPRQEGVISPRAVILTSRELRDNKHNLLDHVDLYEAFFIRSVIKQVPRLAKPRGATVDGVEMFRNGKEHYLSLVFNQSDTDRLCWERDEICYAIGSMANGTVLNVDHREPEIHVARMGPSVPRSAAMGIKSFVAKQLPMKVQLAPVHDPNAGLEPADLPGNLNTQKIV